MTHQIPCPGNDPRELTQSVLQITEMLGLYQAELARILGCKCHAIGEYAMGRASIPPQTRAWSQACLLVHFYRRLFEVTGGDEAAMHHWLRKKNEDLGSSPLLFMVDDNQLAQLLDYVAGLTGVE